MSVTIFTICVKESCRSNKLNGRECSEETHINTTIKMQNLLKGDEMNGNNNSSIDWPTESF